MIGMCCPFCGSENNRVIDTTAINDGIRRRRACQDCRMRWNTFEFSEDSEKQLQKQRIDLVRQTVDARFAIREAIEKLQRIKI